MPGQLITIARNTFVEAVRQPIYFILIVLCGLLQIINTWVAAFSMGYTDTAEVSSDNKMLLDVGLATVFVCGTLLAAFVATAVISREIENKTVLTVVSKPVSRVSLVLGKYLGSAAAMLIAVATMLVFLQLALVHGVLSTTADELHVPLLLFTGLAVFVAFAVGVWTNFFYGWVFSQTTTMLLFPLIVLAWLGSLFVSRNWEVQGLFVAFKPQVGLASIAVLMSMLVLTAIATAASARLGQVMTIVVCAGAFVLGLMSNALIGTGAIRNTFVGQIATAEAQSLREVDWAEPGARVTVELRLQPRQTIPVGAPFYYGPFPNGSSLSVRNFEPYTGDLGESRQFLDSARSPALVVTESEGRRLVVRRAGGSGALLKAPPAADDYVFIRPTRVAPLSLVAWAVIPNFQAFWLVDAVTQNVLIPGRHLVLLTFYTLAQVVAFLSLAVILFQRREVG